MDAITKIEHHIGQNAEKQNILLMDLIKAFGTINRTILRNTLYKKCPLIQTILRIRRGRNNTTLQAKHKRGTEKTS